MLIIIVSEGAKRASFTQLEVIESDVHVVKQHVVEQNSKVE
jgi:hypothetical protein